MIIMPERQWGPVPKYDVKHYFLADGLNQGTSPLDIGDGQLTEVKNMIPALYPALTVRKGMDRLGANQIGNYVTYLRKFRGNYIKGDKDGVYRLVGNWETVQSVTSAPNRYWQMSEYKGDLVMVDGIGKPLKYNGSSVNPIAQAPDTAKSVALHANRMFMVATTSPNMLRWSKFDDIDIWTTFLNEAEDPGFQPVETNDGEIIEGLYPFRDRLMIFKRHSFHELFGDRGPDFQILNTSTHVGCVAFRTICEVNGILYWLGHDGVYNYNGGLLPDRPISDAVKPYIESINWNAINECVGGTDGRRYYISLPTGEAQIPNVTLVYDPEKRSWWVHDYVATSFYEEGETWITGRSNGLVFRMDVGDTDVDNPITWNFTTKAFADDLRQRRKSFNRLYLIADVPVGSELDIWYSPYVKEEIWTHLRHFTSSIDLLNVRIPIFARPSEYFRIRVTGSGPVMIHGLVREMTVRG